MTRFRHVMPLGVASLVLVASAGLRMLAQERTVTSATASTPESKSPGSVQDALLRPYHFTFTKPTPLVEVARQLSRSINAPVVVDRAALDRLGLKVDDEVQLEMEGVRLKTGLKLLLDQLDLTYKIVPEDNLLIFTDPTGADDPTVRLIAEVKSLHRELHDLQEAVDEVRAVLGIDTEDGARMRKPTIIEEVPEGGANPARPKDAPAPGSAPARSRPGV